MKSKKEITVAVLALQGAFIEHEKILERLGVNCIELRQKADLTKAFDALILPGGESTVQGKLLREMEMLEPLKRRIEEGMPVMGTCAGLILLSQQIENDERKYFATLPVKVKRNAYGRQLGSFYIKGHILGIENGDFPMEFIRAPYIMEAKEGVEILARDASGNITGVKYQNQVAYAFHPELTDDMRVHKKFLELL